MLFAFIISMNLLIEPVYASWWNTTYKNCKNLQINESSGKSVLNKPIEYNFTGLILPQGAWSMRIVDEPCNGGGYERPFEVIDNSSTSVRAVFQVNLSNSNILNWSVYYNTTTTVFPNVGYVITFRDSFESGNINTTYWTISENDPANITAHSTDYKLYGSKSLKITITGAYYNRLYKSIASNTGTWEMYIRESGSTASAISMPLNMDDGAKAVRNAKMPSISSTKYVQYISGDPAWQVTGVSWVASGAWWKSVITVNSSKLALYINNISVRNSTSLNNFDNLYQADVESASVTEYFDEYRFYSGVFDQPDQRYNISLGSEQSQPIIYGATIRTPIGTATNWSWAINTTTSVVKCGTANNWSWRIISSCTNSVPNGTANNWSWTQI